MRNGSHSMISDDVTYNKMENQKPYKTMEMKSKIDTPQGGSTSVKIRTTRKVAGIEERKQTSQSSSHSQYFGKKRRLDELERITRDEYYGISEATTDSCVQGPEGKQYTESEKREKMFRSNLDPVPIGVEFQLQFSLTLLADSKLLHHNTAVKLSIPSKLQDGQITDPAWTDACRLAYEFEMAEKLEFLVTEGKPMQQLSRLQAYMRDFARISEDGFRIEVLDSVCVILDFLDSTRLKEPSLQEVFVSLLKNVHKPILLNKSSDVNTRFDQLTRFIGFLGCLLLGLEEEPLFKILANALMWHLSLPDYARAPGTVRRRTTLLAGAPVLYHAAARMLAVSMTYRFKVFLNISYTLACASKENCIELLKENILENIFYRFNPYFPERELPVYDCNPADPRDYNVKLGDSSLNMATTLNLLLVLVMQFKKCCEKDPKFHLSVPLPDHYALRCFVWAYRYECLSSVRPSVRITMTVLVSSLLKCFGKRLDYLAGILMPDVLCLSVATEIRIVTGWASTVNFNTAQKDVHFKKVLIYLCVDFIKTFPYSKPLLKSLNWVVGLMYLLDPGLATLRAKWSMSHYEDLRMTALQALVCVLPLAPTDLAKDCGLIRRIMWYVEWYSAVPYELPVLYWCLRLLQTATYRPSTLERESSVNDIFETHGIFILINLCESLMGQQMPMVEMRQVVLALTLRLITSCMDFKRRVICEAYPDIKWPLSITMLGRTMLNEVLMSLERSYIISDRWIIALLNYIWEGIIWRDDDRKNFIANNGVYQLLDLITMCRAPVQCLAMALLCDIASAGAAVSQLVSWRASRWASHSCLVKTGASIATLLASVVRDECGKLGVRLNEKGVIQDLFNPLRSAYVQKLLEKSNKLVHNSSPVCYAASDLAGSRMSKAYALLQLLSADLSHKTSIADETYNLYRNIELEPEDEAILVLCSHFLTEKLMEAWAETHVLKPFFVLRDAEILEEFIQINKGWAAKIKKQQEAVMETDRKKNHGEEFSLYSFLGRVRVNIALDALREVRCAARTADRQRLFHAMLADAVCAHHRRAEFSANHGCEPVLPTFRPHLDDQNITGQNVKTYGIQRPNATVDESPSPTPTFCLK